MQDRLAAKRDVAVVGLRDPQDRLLMIRTRRLPERWQPIGGGMKRHEQPLETVMRELREEAQLVLERTRFELVLETDYDFGDGTVYFYQAAIDPTCHHLEFNPREIVEHRWVSVAEALCLPMYAATKKFVNQLVDR